MFGGLLVKRARMLIFYCTELTVCPWAASVIYRAPRRRKASFAGVSLRRVFILLFHQVIIQNSVEKVIQGYPLSQIKSCTTSYSRTKAETFAVSKNASSLYGHLAEQQDKEFTFSNKITPQHIEPRRQWSTSKSEAFSFSPFRHHPQISTQRKTPSTR